MTWKCDMSNYYASNSRNINWKWKCLYHKMWE